MDDRQIPSPSPDADQGLQFGHGGDAVDDQVIASDQDSLLRFNSATAATPWMTSLASMGPPDSSGFNSATAATPWMTAQSCTHRTEMGGLQFGHGGDAVDDLRNTAAGTRRPVASFNSATAATPWMTLGIVGG